MKYAIIENGKVVNIAKADSPLADNWVEAGSARIGDLWDGQSFNTLAPPMPTPEELRAGMRTTRAEFAVSAHEAGLITEDEALAWAGGNNLPAVVSPHLTGLADRVEALTAAHIHRLNPMILSLQSALGLTDEQVDALF